MKLNIQENIRNLRKERMLTQEQLAEALGVTVGAVSKWESGANTPDIAVIAELADFFEVSIDALLGYNLHAGTVERLSKRVFELGAEKKFTEAAAEAEKALVKYPNNFAIVRTCANIYCMIGIELSDDNAHRRQLELYQRALELIDQNNDPNFSEWTIKNRIAEAYVCLGDADKALEIMKTNNAQGINNGNIAQILCENQHKYDAGLTYMFDDLMHNITGVINNATTGALAYIGLGDPAHAENIAAWACGMLEGLAVPGKVCYVQRESARLRFTMAGAALADGRTADAEKHLGSAYELLKQYSMSPDNSMSGTWLRNGEKYVSFDDLGEDTVAGANAKLERLQARLIRESHVLPNFIRNGTSLTDIWNSIIHK